MNNAEQIIFNCGIVPVITLDDPSDAAPVCAALLNGGINVAEITFRTSAAAEAIKAVSETMPEVFVGAGTVSNIESLKKALEAGAKFIVSPGLNLKVVEYCAGRDIPVFPGVSSPTDIEAALPYGLKTLKFFPAGALGGPPALKAISAPYGGLRFMPTGGIDSTNLLGYLSLSNVIACGGSWMCSGELVKTKNYGEITRLAKLAVMKMHNFTFAHTAINTACQDDAVNLANLFDCTLNTGVRETNVSAFAGNFIEIMGGNGRGEHGHIGFRTTNLARAICYFEKHGYEFDYDTLRGTRENPEFIYFRQQFGTFAVHLVQ